MESNREQLGEATRERYGEKLFWSACWLLAVFGISSSCCAAVAGQRHGWSGVFAAGVAVLVVGTAQLASLIFLAVVREPRAAVQAALGATLLRMVMTFPVGLVLTNLNRDLAESGLFGMIVVNYLVGLLFETILVVRLVGSSPSAAKAS